MLTGPPLVIGILFALPFLSGTGDKSYRRRPFSVVIVILAVTAIGTLTCFNLRPSVARWPRWAMIPYLPLADGQNTILAALLMFSDRLIYPLGPSFVVLSGPWRRNHVPITFSA